MVYKPVNCFPLSQWTEKVTLLTVKCKSVCNIMSCQNEGSINIGILLPKLFWLTVRKQLWFRNLKKNLEMVFCCQNCSDLLWEKIVLVIQKTFEIQGWRPRICKMFEITRTIYSNSERSEQFLVTECFFNLFLEVSHI